MIHQTITPRVVCFFSVFFLCNSILYAQVGVGTNNPAQSAALEVFAVNKDKGLLIPRILESEKLEIPSPANGLLIYQIDAGFGFYVYSTVSNSWSKLTTNQELNLAEDFFQKLSAQTLTLNQNLSLSGTITSGDISANGTISATAFVGDGSGLTGITGITSSIAGITDVQVSAITANSAKVGYTEALVSANTAVIANTDKISYPGDQDIQGIATNTSAILTLQGEQTTQNSAIALNTAKTGITDVQVSAITANSDKVGYTEALVSANADVSANTLKTEITAGQASEITANTAKVGITTQQASDITTNNSKTGITSDQATAIIANTDKVGYTEALVSANLNVAANTAKTGITAEQVSEISANTAKVGFKADLISEKQNTLTNSAGLSGALDDETGTGFAVFATSPTLVTPILGTPSNLVGTNITGTAANLTAGNVTTNANLTGDVTSVGNQTTLSNAAVIGQTLTGYTAGEGIVAASDNILQAIQKVDGNIAVAITSRAPLDSPTFTGTVTANAFVGDGSGLTELPASSIADASASVSGVVTTETQTFAGAKTFSSDLTTNGITVGRGLNSKIENTAIGNGALSSNTTGFFNTASGFEALSSNTTGDGNTASGSSALRSNTEGSRNTASGYDALNSNTTGYANTASGTQALRSNTYGDGNTASGVFALQSNTTGGNNTAIGTNALQSNTTGDSNTASGVFALQSNTTGGNNTAIGYNAGAFIANGSTSNTTSDYSVYLGVGTKASVDNVQNEIVIGYNAIGSGSNTVTLGNSDITDVKTSGTVTAKAFVGDGSGLTELPAPSIADASITSEKLATEIDATKLADGSVTNTVLQYIGTLTSDAQTQIEGLSTSLSTKANLASPAFTGTVSGIDKTMVGLSSVDNTSDTNKPISTLTQSALDLKASLASPTFTGTVSATSFVGDGSGLTELPAPSIADASASVSGVVTTETQTFAGAKTFSSDLTTNGITVGRGSNSIFNNTAVGTMTLASNTTGFFNTASGFEALGFNTTGTYNTASGSFALSSNTTGDGNTASGYDALRSNSTGSDNTASGSSALRSNTTGFFNTASGAFALSSNTTGDGNTASGSSALRSNTEGSRNTASGYDALRSNSTGSDNTASGAFALRSNTSGDSNTASGFEALTSNTTGFFNTASGFEALSSNTTGTYNTAIGYNAGAFIANGSTSNTTSNYSVYLGVGTKASVDNVQNEIVIGYNAIGSGSNTVTLGNSDITDVKTSGTVTAKAFVGDGSGLTELPAPSIADASASVSGVVTTGIQTFAGAKTFSSDLTTNGITVGRGLNSKIENTAIGNGALSSNTTGEKNTASGFEALTSNTTGFFNTASGFEALSSNTTGYANTASGSSALRSNTEGSRNTASGYDALNSNTTGYANTASGTQALRSNTYGDGNTAIGYNAGAFIANGSTSNTTSNYSVYLGVGTKASVDNVQNEIVIGYNAIGSGSNTVTLGNSNISNVTSRGLFTSTSDRRLKENIKGTKYGLDEVLKLEPVDYNFKSNRLVQIGFIAQDVKTLIPEVVTGKEGDIQKGETLGIAYTSLIPVLTKAIQEQQVLISRLEQMLLDSLKKQEAIEKELIEIRASVKQ